MRICNEWRINKDVEEDGYIPFQDIVSCQWPDTVFELNIKFTECLLFVTTFTVLPTLRVAEACPKSSHSAMFSNTLFPW
jgi:hypothetical protein